jgi:peptidyl-prolyl cis-trans isomerase SurA
MSNATSVFRTSALLLVLLVSGSLVASAQSSPSKSKTSKKSKPAASASIDTQVLATVGSEQILYSDVDRAFRKNMNRRDTRLVDVPRDTALEFLRLYTNYRLKVHDAKDRGIDQDDAVRNDILSNRRLLSETFFFDKKVADGRIAQLMDRRTRELEIGIILCSISDPATRNVDSAASKAKAERLIAAMRKGADFEQLAKDSSDDRETSAKGGRLPFITGGSMIKAVEDAAYGLKDGQFSAAPVESRFGFFIIKLFRSQPRSLVRARHILIGNQGELDSAGVDARADSLIKVLKASGNNADLFAILAKKFSDDKASAEKGGDLGSFYSRSGGLEASSNRLVPAFEDAMFSLNDGELSQKVRTLYGVHIIRRDSTRIPDQAVERESAKRVYRRLYYEEDKRILLDSLRSAWNWGWNETVLARTFASIDTTKNTTDTSWTAGLDASMRSETLYRLGTDGGYTVGAFADSLRRRADMRALTLNRAGFDRAVVKMTDQTLLDKATANLEQQYPDFKALIQEFSDGILLFKVEEQEVWSKLRFDTVEARTYFDTMAAAPMTPARYAFTEIFVTKDSMAKALRQRVDAGEDITELAAQFTERTGMRDKRGNHGLVDPAKNKLAAKVRDLNPKVGSIYGPFSYEFGNSIVRVDNIELPRKKTFEEALPDLAPLYQDALQKRLQEAWLSKVRVKHPVTLNMDIINKLYVTKR